MVERVGTADTIVTHQGTRAPAKGERFLVARLKTQNGFWWREYEDDFDSHALHEKDDLIDPEPSYAVEVGAKRTRVAVSALHDGDLVVSAPKEETEVELVVTVAGQDQAFSLTSGKLTTEPVVEEQVGISRQYSPPEYENGDMSVSQALLFTDAYLTSYHPTEGWADSGRAWLTLAVDHRTTPTG